MTVAIVSITMEIAPPPHDSHAVTGSVNMNHEPASAKPNKMLHHFRHLSKC